MAPELLPSPPLAPDRRVRPDSYFGYVLGSWLIFRTLLWTAVTWLTYPNAPLDVVEMLSWGREWQWGYPKHPPLPAWVAEAGWRLSGGSLFGVYLAGYALVALTVWAVWRLARQMVPAPDALLAALCLEGVLFYTYWGHELNHNVVLTACWALTALYTYQAFLGNRLRDWLATGTSAGLGVLAKYSLVFLLVPLLAWAILDARAARAWRRPGPYLAVLVMLLLCGPHLLWATNQGWPTLAYARERIAGAPEAAGQPPPWQSARGTRPRRPPAAFPRVVDPLTFLANQALALLPLAAVLALGLRRGPGPLNAERRAAGTYAVVLVLGPLALMQALALILGLHLQGPWGMPIWVGLGLLAVLLVRPGPAPRRPLALGLLSCNLLALAVLAGHGWLGPAVSPRPSRIHFPGRALAAAAERLWRSHCSGPIPAVAGDTWLAGNIGLHADGRPHVLLTAQPHEAPPPWRRHAAQEDDSRLRRDGGLLVWDALAWGTELPWELQDRFPEAEPGGVIRLPNGAATVGVAVLSPASGGGQQRVKASPEGQARPAREGSPTRNLCGGAPCQPPCSGRW